MKLKNENNKKHFVKESLFLALTLSLIQYTISTQKPMVRSRDEIDPNIPSWGVQ